MQNYLEIYAGIHTIDPLLGFVEGFGWIGFVIYILFREVIPAVRGLLQPELKAGREAKQRRAEEEISHKYKIEEEELQRRRMLDERWVLAVERLDDSIKCLNDLQNQMCTTLALVGERLIEVQSDLTFNRNGITVILERTDKTKPVKFLAKDDKGEKDVK